MTLDTPNNPSASSKKGMVLTLISIACVITFSLVGFVYKMTAPRVMSPKELVNNGAIVYQEPKPVLPFELLDQHGQAFTPERLQGKWTLLFFGFSHCPDFCPTTLATLRTVVDQLDDETQKKLQVVMVSVDPSRDTPERLNEYFAGFQFNDEYTNFIGATGEFFRIRVMADNFYIPVQKQMLNTPAMQDHAAHMSHDEGGQGEEQAEAMAHQGMDHQAVDHSQHMGDVDYTMVHGENIVLINPQGQFRAIFQSPFTVARLKATFRSVITTYE